MNGLLLSFSQVKEIANALGVYAEDTAPGYVRELLSALSVTVHPRRRHSPLGKACPIRRCCRLNGSWS